MSINRIERKKSQAESRLTSPDSAHDYFDPSNFLPMGRRRYDLASSHFFYLEKRRSFRKQRRPPAFFSFFSISQDEAIKKKKVWALTLPCFIFINKVAVQSNLYNCITYPSHDIFFLYLILEFLLSLYPFKVSLTSNVPAIPAHQHLIRVFFQAEEPHQITKDTEGKNRGEKSDTFQCQRVSFVF